MADGAPEGDLTAVSARLEEISQALRAPEAEDESVAELTAEAAELAEEAVRLAEAELRRPPPSDE